MALVAEIFVHALGNDFTHLGNGRQFLLRSLRQCVDIPEMPRNIPGRSLSHVADADREEDTLEGHVPGFPEAVQEPLRRAFLPALQHDELAFAEVVEIGRGLHQVQVVELVHRSVARQHVHGLAAEEVHELALDLRGAAIGVGAEPLGFALGFHERRAAIGTHLREGRAFRAGLPLGFLHAGDLGNDLSAFFHIDPVTFVDIQHCHLVLVHEGGALHHGPGQEHGFHVRDRRHRAGAAHLVVDGQDGRQGLLGLEFIRDRPARGLGRVAERALGVQFVDLDDDAIGGIRKLLAGRIPAGDESLDLLDIATDAALVGDGEPPGRGGLQSLIMGREVHLTDRDVVQRAHEAAVRHFLRILQLQRTAGCIAGIREWLVLVGLPFPVQPVEGFVGHEYLAADLELRRPAFAPEGFRDIGDLPGIGGNIVTHHAVTAGQGPEQLAVPVSQANGRSVELELAAPGERGLQRLGSPLREFLHLGDAVGIAQRKHRILVRIFRELLSGTRLDVLDPRRFQVAAHTLGGGVRRPVLRILRLQVLQLVHLLHIVLPAVLPENRLQPLDPLFRLREIHFSVHKGCNLQR